MRGAVTDNPSKTEPGVGSWSVSLGHKGFIISYSTATKEAAKAVAAAWLKENGRS